MIFYVPNEVLNDQNGLTMFNGILTLFNVYFCGANLYTASQKGYGVGQLEAQLKQTRENPKYNQTLDEM